MFEDFSYSLGETVWKKGWKASGGRVVGARRGPRVVYLPLLAALQAPLWDSFRISKQFREG